MPVNLEATCPFCHIDPTTNLILQQTPDFTVMADFAPIALAHLLIIPRPHLPHLAALPPELDEEFMALRQRFGDFVHSAFGGVMFWENGVFGQSVPHAHLHVMSGSVDTAIYAKSGIAFAKPAELREAHRQGEATYFTIEHEGIGRYMPPDSALRQTILDASRHRPGMLPHVSRDDQRQLGAPYIAAMGQCWQEYRESNP